MYKIQFLYFLFIYILFYVRNILSQWKYKENYFLSCNIQVCQWMWTNMDIFLNIEDMVKWGKVVKNLMLVCIL